jgi:hypothetical protein
MGFKADSKSLGRPAGNQGNKKSKVTLKMPDAETETLPTVKNTQP